MKRQRLFELLACVLVVLGGPATPALGGIASYTYDSLNRLTRAGYADGTVVTYTYDAAGNRLSEVVDTAAPTVTIELPTAVGVYTTSAATLDLSGAAADDVAIAEVTWSNDRGGSGTAVVTTNWTVSGILLQPGVNVLTVTATDTVGKTAVDTLTVTLAVSTPTNTPTQEPTPTPIASNTPMESATPTQTPTRTPTFTGTSTATATSAHTPTKSATITATPTLACVVGTGTVASCTESALNACLPGGVSFDGTVTFNCGGAATITVTSTKTISRTSTTHGVEARVFKDLGQKVATTFGLRA